MPGTEEALKRKKRLEGEFEVYKADVRDETSKRNVEVMETIASLRRAQEDLEKKLKAEISVRKQISVSQHTFLKDEIDKLKIQCLGSRNRATADIDQKIHTLNARLSEMESRLPAEQKAIEEGIIKSNNEIRSRVEVFLGRLEKEAVECKHRHLGIGSLLDDSLVHCGEEMKSFRADRENKADEIRERLETAVELNMKNKHKILNKFSYEIANIRNQTKHESQIREFHDTKLAEILARQVAFLERSADVVITSTEV